MKVFLHVVMIFILFEKFIEKQYLKKSMVNDKVIIFILWFARRNFYQKKKLRYKIFRNDFNNNNTWNKISHCHDQSHLSLVDLKSSFEYSTFQNRSLLTTRILKTKSSCSQFNYARAIKPFLIGFVHAKKGNRVHNNTPQSLDSAAEIAPLKDYFWKFPLSFYVTIGRNKNAPTDVNIGKINNILRR